MVIRTWIAGYKAYSKRHLGSLLKQNYNLCFKGLIQAWGGARTGVHYGLSYPIKLRSHSDVSQADIAVYVIPMHASHSTQVKKSGKETEVLLLMNVWE